MKDVSRKTDSLRRAVAECSVAMSAETLAVVARGEGPKGDPLPVARTAGIMAVKDTYRLVPLCHPVRVDHADVAFEYCDDRIRITCSVTAVDRTGVEMEAMAGAMVAALTVYDMLKSIDATMVIGETRLLRKEGGKGDFDTGPARGLRAAVLVVSDSTAAGERPDFSGVEIARYLRSQGFQVVSEALVPDSFDRIQEALTGFVSDGIDLVVTTGGTGLGPRDVTPEATAAVVEREARGIVEAARMHGLRRTPYAALSRGLAGVSGNTLIVNLPGSTRGVRESLDALFPGLLHVFPMLRGEGHG